jgi:hypothetical protein
MNNFTLEKVDESEYFINPEIIIPLYNCTVLDSNTGELKIKLDNQIDQFLSDLKNNLIKKVYEKSTEIFKKYKDLDVLNEYYCDVKRLFLFNKEYEEIFLVNNKTTHSIEQNSVIKGTIQIRSILISKASFTPIFDLIEVTNISTDLSTTNFLDSDSDNGSVIEYL